MKTFVTRNKFPHVKVASNTEKVGQAWSKSRSWGTPNVADKEKINVCPFSSMKRAVK